MLNVFFTTDGKQNVKCSAPQSWNDVLCEMLCRSRSYFLLSFYNLEILIFILYFIKENTYLSTDGVDGDDEEDELLHRNSRSKLQLLPYFSNSVFPGYPKPTFTLNTNMKLIKKKKKKKKNDNDDEKRRERGNKKKELGKVGVLSNLF